jgi:hypothetical protein
VTGPRWCGAAVAACMLLAAPDVLPRAAVLHARHAQLREALAHNAFQRPVHLTSHEADDGVFGEIVSEVPAPFEVVRSTLVVPAQWCEILILHLNTKHCREAPGGAPQRLDVIVGRKFDQPLEDAHRLTFSFRADDTTDGYLRVELRADSGPLGTRDYRIVLEAVPASPERTVLRLAYSYGYGVASRLALGAYLATAGRDKVGFTVVRREGGKDVLVGGMRGLVERNTMRYQLAIEAFLGAQSAPREARLEKSLRDWFAASARHPRQLYEMSQEEYLSMKRREHRRPGTP